MNDPRHIDGMELPQYRCHKVVGALQIANVGDDGAVSFVDERYRPVVCDEKMFARFRPSRGDFFVVYEDGYRSFSPRQAFLDGYTIIEPGGPRPTI